MEVAIGVKLGVVAEVTLAFANLADYHRTFNTCIAADLTKRFLDSALDDVDTGGLIGVCTFQTFDSLLCTDVGNATAGDNTFLDGSAGCAEGIIATVFLFLLFGLACCANLKYADTSAELAQAFLKLLLVVVRSGSGDFGLQLLDALVDVFLGTGTVLDNRRPWKASLILGLGTTVVMVLSALLTWPLDHYLLSQAAYLQTMAFMIVVIFVVALLNLLAGKLLNGFCKADFMKFAINGAVLGLCIRNTELEFGEAVITALGVGLGFTLALVLLWPSVVTVTL